MPSIFDAMNIQTQAPVPQQGVIPSNDVLSQVMSQSAPWLKSIGQNIKSIQDPNALMQMMAQNNPQLGALLQGGGSMESIVRGQCQQLGINPEDFISQLRQYL